MTETEIQSSKVEKLVNREINITNEMFVKAQDKKAYFFPESEKTRIKTKLYQEYNNYKEYVPLPKRVKSEESAPSVGNVPAPSAPLSMDLPFQLPFETDENKESNKRNIVNEVLNEINQKEFEEDNKNKVGLIPYKPMENNQIVPLEGESSDVSRALVSLRHASVPVPEWHAPWKLHKVLVGHQGWVDCVAVDVSNEWFATGSDDRTVKIWNLATGKLIMTLTGHSHTVKSIAISARSPYMFTASEDKSIKCWDLETNKVIRSYNEHLNGVYSLALHPSLDILFSGGRDSVCRVWDIRTKTNIATLGGHKGSIFSIITQDAEPQVITGSMDTTIRLWDLAEMSTSTILTHHKKAVRSLLFHPIEYTFASAGADNIKRWKCPNGEFLNNISGHKGILNTISLNQNNVLFAGSNNGQLRFYDWKSGYCFDEKQTPLQPGSIDADASILASTFDKTGTRLITCEGDKTIKIYKEDVNATEETHPIDMEKWKVEWRSRRSIY